MNRIIHKEIIPSTDPRLNRHINHDSKSREYAFDTSNIEIVSVKHKRLIPIMDQGQIGSCTGHAGIGCINTEPFIQPKYPVFQPTEDGAISLYSAAEEIDHDGPYPPKDNGSSGLSVAKALKNVKMISSYQHTFTLDDALKALTVRPIMIGSYWYTGMDNPDETGIVHPSGDIRGGHEYFAFENDVENGLITCANSWSEDWGFQGCFKLTWTDFWYLLSQQGDVTVLIQ